MSQIPSPTVVSDTAAQGGMVERVDMRRLALIVGLGFALAGPAQAVTVWELSGKCGDDAKAYCDGVGYGDEMTACLNQHKKQISGQCRALVDRINGGEKVSLF